MRVCLVKPRGYVASGIRGNAPGQVCASIQKIIGKHKEGLCTSAVARACVFFVLTRELLKSESPAVIANKYGSDGQLFY